MVRDTKPPIWFHPHQLARQAAFKAGIESYYGKEFFKGKKLLELGCAIGQFGRHFAALGADVHYVDANEENLAYIKSPNKTLVDLDISWPFESHYDICLCMGLLYHLIHPGRVLSNALKHTDHIVVESMVLTTKKIKILKETERSGVEWGQRGWRNLISVGIVEACFERHGFIYNRYRRNAFNSFDEQFDLPDDGTPHRSIWFARRKECMTD